MLRSLPQTIFFNFKYFPFHTAIRLPVLLYKPRLRKLKGTCRIEGDAKFGMIQLGVYSTAVHPNSGVVWENWGGEVIFKGRCKMGNDSVISVGRHGVLEIGPGFLSTSGGRLLCTRSITIGTSVLFGWGVTLMDNNYHPLVDATTDIAKPSSGPIKIGDYNWLGKDVVVMHSVSTPHRVVVGAHTILTKSTSLKPYSLVTSVSPAKIVATDVYCDIGGSKMNDPYL